MEIYIGIGAGMFLYISKIFAFHWLTGIRLLSIGRLLKYIHSTKPGLVAIDIVLAAAAGHFATTGSIVGIMILISFAISSFVYICAVLLCRKARTINLFSSSSLSTKEVRYAG